MLKKKIDVNFSFTTDTPGYWTQYGLDPDKYSPTLKEYHRILWSKELPNGERMELAPVDDYTYLQWEDFRISSDTLMVEFQYKRYQHMMDQVKNFIPDSQNFFRQLIYRGYTIGGHIIFPQHPGSMNQNRGTHKRIADRWDLTLECIRRYYNNENNETNPLYKTIEGDKAFFDLFVDFKGYVDFFFLQDCVSEDYSSVHIWYGDATFTEEPLPETIYDYFIYLAKEHDFLDKRNRRIQEYCVEQGL